MQIIFNTSDDGMPTAAKAIAKAKAELEKLGFDTSKLTFQVVDESEEEVDEVEDINPETATSEELRKLSKEHDARIAQAVEVLTRVLEAKEQGVEVPHNYGGVETVTIPVATAEIMVEISNAYRKGAARELERLAKERESKDFFGRN